MMIVLICLLLRWCAGTPLTLDTMVDSALTTSTAAQFTMQVATKTTLHVFVFPCVGRINIFVSSKGDAVGGPGEIKKILWTDGQDVPQQRITVSNLAVGATLNVGIEGLNMYNATDFGRVRLVVSENKDWPATNTVLANVKPDADLKDDNTIAHVLFQKIEPMAGATDNYDVFVRNDAFVDGDKDPLNGCSVDTLMELNASVVLTEEDADDRLFSFQLNNTHRRDDDPPLIVAIRVTRTYSGGRAWQSLYPLLVVGEDGCGRAVCSASTATLTVIGALIAFVIHFI